MAKTLVFVFRGYDGMIYGSQVRRTAQANDRINEKLLAGKETKFGSNTGLWVEKVALTNEELDNVGTEETAAALRAKMKENGNAQPRY